MKAKTPTFPPKADVCKTFDLVEIVFICVMFTFVLIFLTQAGRILSSGFIHSTAQRSGGACEESRPAGRDLQWPACWKKLSKRLPLTQVSCCTKNLAMSRKNRLTGNCLCGVKSWTVPGEGPRVTCNCGKTMSRITVPSKDTDGICFCGDPDQMIPDSDAQNSALSQAQGQGQMNTFNGPSSMTYEQKLGDQQLTGHGNEFFDFKLDGNAHILCLAGFITLIVLILLRKVFYMFKGRRRRRRRRSRSLTTCACRSRMPLRSRIHETKSQVRMSTPEHYLIILIGVALLYLLRR